jgi:hypothetical protein
VDFRAKLSQDTGGTDLPAAVYEGLLGSQLTLADSGAEVIHQTDPGGALLRVFGGVDRGPNTRGRPPGPLEGRVVVLP